MFRVLLESRARRQRRRGGVALSVITHLALIAAATAATARGPGREREKAVPVVIKFTPPPAPKPPPVPETRPVRAVITNRSISIPDQVRHIVVPTSIPTSLPEINLAAGTSLDSIVIGSGPRGTGVVRGDLISGEREGGSE